MASVACHSLLTWVLVVSILITVLSGHAVEGREVPKGSKDVDMKKPDCNLGQDGSVTIPGIGRVMVPPPFEDASIGRAGGTPRRYIPGNDDTLIPNPGYEVPIGGGNFADP
ncbi:putative cell wall protein [Eucalyptus grandis]|uniref:putative cell wall protein n=1 Tax=Eucalyptus grandis TaxID=71139 RepID=UPI00192EB63D|nr:putative cell wall protein [Eucalyptus grandis]